MRKAPKTAWKKGQSGNPEGRKPGSRNKLSEAFIFDILQDWEKHGVQAIKSTREQDPATYLRVVASLVPKDVNIKHTLVAELEQLTDEQIQTRLEQLRRATAITAGIPADQRTH